MLQLLRVSTLPTADIQRQANREVVGNYRILLVRDRVEEYLKHVPGFLPGTQYPARSAGVQKIAGRRLFPSLLCLTLT